MARRVDFVRCIDFAALPEPLERSVVFFAVIAYPEADAGYEDAPGAAFAAALVGYWLWASRRQYGLREMRARGLPVPKRESFEPLLFRGGARIQRRLTVSRLWHKRMLWVDTDSAQITPALLGALAEHRRSVRSELRRDIEYWRTMFRLTKRNVLEMDTEESLQQLSSHVKESRPVLHMIEQVQNDIFSNGYGETSIPWAERVSWRRSFLRSPVWIDGAIREAERWRLSQEPHRQNGLAASDLIELRL
jgi:hypothetical protein